MKTVKTFFLTLAFLGLSLNAFTQAYIITGSGTSFTATRNGATIGLPNQVIQTVIAFIQSSANGAACTIQFGSGTTLNIGAANITFAGTWGTVTLTGGLTSSNSANDGVIVMRNAVSVVSQATIRNTSTAASANTFFKNSTGTLLISGGSVGAYGGVAVMNISTGNVTIRNANVYGTGTARAVYNTSSANIAIQSTGAETRVYTANAITIDNGGTGKITVSGNSSQNYPFIYSTYADNRYGTIFLYNTGTSNAARLEITAGSIGNTVNGGNTIRNNSTGGITISGTGNIYSNSGTSLWNAHTGTVTVNSGGIVDQRGNGVAIENSSTGAINVSGGTVKASYSSGSGRAIFNSSSGTVTISGGTVSSFAGIAVDNGASGRTVVSGGTVTSAVTNVGLGTIFMTGSGTSLVSRIQISGGTVTNTAAGGNTIRNDATGSISVTGGKVEKASSGIAISNASTGTVNISSGEVFGTGTARAIYNTSSGAINISSSGNATRVHTENAIAIDNGGAGKITVTGNSYPYIYSRITDAGYGAIYLNNSGNSTATRLEITGGTVWNLGGDGGNAICNRSTGEVKISGGRVYENSTGIAICNYHTGVVTVTGGTVENFNGAGVAIWNASTGAVNISGGTVRAYNAGGRAIFNISTAAVNISGGTVSSTTGITVDNAATGKITVTGGTVTSAVTNVDYGTIFLNNSGTATATRLEVANGTVRNTATGGNAIRNNSTGAVIIGHVGSPYGSIATVSATTGVAVWNNNTGAVTVNCSGGTGALTNKCTVSATTGRAIYNASTGKITVSGNNTEVTSANTNYLQGSIFLDNSGTATAARLEITGGTVRNTAANGNAIRNFSTGAITISGGTVSATGNGGRAIGNDSSATLNITGGTVSSTNWVAADNGSGTINISGGTVQATTGIAVRNAADGKITVSGTAMVTSANTGATNGGTFHGTIRLMGTGGLTVNGGTIRNTSTGHAIHNTTTGPVTISDGMILAREGYAVDNASTGTVTFSKGIVFAYGTAATDIISSAYSGAGANSMLVAWNKTAEMTNYPDGGSADIFKLPPTGTATWGKQGTLNGILAASGSTAGFIPVTGVSIGGAVSYYTVKFDGEEINIPSQTIEEGQKVSKPANPERENYYFGGWFTDEGTFEDEWDFANDVVTDDMTLWAKWLDNPEITSVSISPEMVTLEPGQTQQFSVFVTTVGGADPSVAWSITGKSSAATNISNGGLLSIGGDETAETITVRVTSVTNASFYDEATVTIHYAETPAILNVTVSPKTPTVGRGQTRQFTAVVETAGGADEEVTWSVSGNSSDGTTISAGGLLAVDEDETAVTLTVKATSNFDASFYDETTVTIADGAYQEVFSVTVSPNTVTLQPEGTQQFTVVVDAVGGADESVAWSLTGNSSTNTTITASGLLTIGSDETETIYVKATSVFNNAVYDEAMVVIYLGSEPKVLGVAISPPTATVEAGGTTQFTVAVNAVGGADESVSWSVTGQSTGSTTAIDDDGILTVDINETAATLTVKVTSVNDPTVYDEATVTVSSGATVPEVSSVSVTPPTTTVAPGATKQFEAVVEAEGGADDSVKWSVSGNTSTSTAITPNGGLLTVGSNESAATIKVRATSNFDPTVYGEATVTVSSSVTGAEEWFAPEVNVYPNPFTEVIRVVTGENGEAVLRVLNAAGIIVHTQNITSPDEIIRLEHLPAGVYFFVIEKDGKAKTIKMIKI